MMLTFVILFFAETKAHSLGEIAGIFEVSWLVIGRSYNRRVRVEGVIGEGKETSANVGQAETVEEVSRI